jgi:hypothetical protein
MYYRTYISVGYNDMRVITVSLRILYQHFVRKSLHKKRDRKNSTVADAMHIRRIHFHLPSSFSRLYFFLKNMIFYC